MAFVRVGSNIIARYDEQTFRAPLCLYNHVRRAPLRPTASPPKRPNFRSKGMTKAAKEAGNAFSISPGRPSGQALLR